MSDCKTLEPLVTSYVDGEIDAATRADIDAHVRACAPCHSRVAAERTIHELLRARREALRRPCASEALRRRCATLAADAGVGDSDASTMRGVGRAVGRRAGAWARPLALAASLVLVVGGAFVYQLTDRSLTVMAAELTADHIKCFGVINPMLGTRQTAAAVEGSLASSFGWPLRLPADPDRAGLELVGARPCLYGEGRVAHIMYRHNGHPVSVFMLPRTTRPDATIDVLGHEAAIWSVDDRTFVLIAREPRAEVERLVAFVHAAWR